MDYKEAGRYWEENAEAWTILSRAGYDTCRDYFNTPCFFKMLPSIQGLQGLDIGCGEGHNTRLAASKGAGLVAFDISKTFIKHAHEEEVREPLGIIYLHSNALSLPFRDSSFDFIMATMSLMDMPNQDIAFREAFRVLKGGGFLQFSITHPCFQTVGMRWIKDETGRKVAMACGDYFFPPEEWIDEWTFGAAPAELKERFPKFKTPYFRMTLSKWLNMLIGTGFVLEEFTEPYADDEVLKAHPEQYDTRVVAFFLIIRCRKP